VSTIAFCVADQPDRSRLIVFARRVAVSVIVVGVGVAVAVAGDIFPGDVPPHIDAADALPGPPMVFTQTVSSSDITLGNALTSSTITWRVRPK